MISNNILDVATAVDIAQFEHVTVRCNRKSINPMSLAPTEENCPKSLNVPLVPKFTVFPKLNEDDVKPQNDPTPAALGNIFSYNYPFFITKYFT